MSSKEMAQIEDEKVYDRLQDEEDDDFLVSQMNMDVTNQYVIFSVGKEDYGIPILSVQEIVSLPNVTRLPGVPEFIPGIINLRGNIIPLYVLRSKFELEARDLTENTIVIIAQLGDENKHKTVGFIVDGVSDVVSIDKDDLREPPEFSGKVDVKYINKIGHIGSRMIIVINLDSFFSEEEAAILESVRESV